MSTIDKIKLSGTTYDIVDSTAIHSMDGYWDSGTTQNAITAATNALAESIAEQGYQTSGDVQNAISGKADTTAVTQAISAAVSGKVDTSTYTAYTAATDSTLSNKADKSEIPSVSGYADSVQYNDTSHYMEFYHGGTGGTKVYEFDASPFLVDGMIENVEIVGYTAPTIADNKVKLTWADGYNVTCDVDNPNTGDGEHSIYDVVKAEFGKMSKRPSDDIKFADDACYQLSSVTFCDTAYFNETDGDFGSAIKLNEIVFFATSPSGFTYSTDIYSFLSSVYDGCETYESTAATYPIMVASLANYSGSTLTIEGTATTWGEYFGNRLQEIPPKSLKITFNTDAGKQDIYIPLSDIFDPTNYYTKSEIDAALSGKADTSAVTADIAAAVSGKADTSAVTADIAAAVSGKVDTTAFTAYSGSVESAITEMSEVTARSLNDLDENKQDELVSGTNIKTINNQSILGSGNIDVQSQPTVSGTTLIFS